jgi:ribonuclease HII
LAILGIDEVGRGPWAGPLVVGACVLGDAKIDGLTDSKKLTAKKREKLDILIREQASFGLGWVSAEELDKIGLIAALRKATRDAAKQIEVPYHEIIIDGTINFLSDTKLSSYVQTIPKADFLVPEVSAASIIAKVARDNYMIKLAERFPNYGFEKHVGYGTAAHREALEKYGPCEEHRHSFKPIAELSNNIKSGHEGEEIAAKYLITLGHVIIERNWKTKWCEIDIISEKDGVLFFSEVKNRKSNNGLDAITPAKQKQMRFAAELYLKNADKPARLLAIAVNNNRVTDFIEL